MTRGCRAKVFEAFKNQGHRTAGAVAVLQGGTSAMFEYYDSDTDIDVFRQEAYFRYLFGINEPDCFGALDLQREEAILFVEQQSEASQRWNGNLRPLEFFQQRYGVDHVYYTHQLQQVLADRGYEYVYTLQGTNTDSGLAVKTEAQLPFLAESVTRDRATLLPLLAECRVIKTPLEVEHLRRACLLSSQAHVYVMRHVQSGMNERQLEALFQAFTRYYGGCRHMSYTCICGSGPNGAILHYGHAGAPNDKPIAEHEMVVLDMGAEFTGYSTDITLSYPIRGIFSDDQRMVYQGVLKAQKAVFAAMRPGVSWVDMHRLAERTIIEHLMEAGLLHNGTVEQMMQAYVGAIFMPHGLGHLLGLNVHDVGGFLEGAVRQKGPGIQYLRTSRNLKAGMVLTVEPGIYFNDPLLDAALANPEQAQFINNDVLQRFRGFGGVRLEDDVLVTETGVENFTIVPREIEDIEEVFRLRQARN
eukprot:TRINITY_DN1149_c0_g1_i2.p1 TRINITY_DN1149_c0_g1~~TRINITY_DN1149_c0_g1_i2.p1  ORF type:complete len:534 (+),score=170.98 TRINITY_DN1149_c0_g1_i2:188-1603(+)